MSIRSVDLMILYSRTADAEKAHQTEQQQPRIAQDQLAANEIKRKEIEAAQVKRPHEDQESGRIAEHPDRKRGKRQGKHGPEDEEAEPEKKTSGSRGGPLHGGSLDITV